MRESEAALRQAARNKDEFLAVLAHELRNPLAPLQTSVELMYMAIQDPRMLIEIIAIMERQLAHVTRLVDDLLDAARLTHGALRIERAPAPLAQILDEATDMHRRACVERGIKLTKIVERAVNVDVDRVRIVQVIANLIHNAVKFTGQGGEINVRAEVYGRNVMIAVDDTGVGIAPELLPFVFELFHHSADERGGLGVGLALCRKLVELHGRTITARIHEPGSGTVFEVRLPDSVTEQAVPRALPLPAPSITTAHDILIVDDNADIVRATSILVTLLGATPHVATAARTRSSSRESTSPSRSSSTSTCRASTAMKPAASCARCMAQTSDSSRTPVLASKKTSTARSRLALTSTSRSRRTATRSPARYASRINHEDHDARDRSDGQHDGEPRGRAWSRQRQRLCIRDERRILRVVNNRVAGCFEGCALDGSIGEVKFDLLADAPNRRLTPVLQ